MWIDNFNRAFSAQLGIYMHSTRKKIKDRFIGDLGINPFDYYFRRGDVQPYKEKYIYDEFDKIIIATANELFKATNLRGKKTQGIQTTKLDVFWCLYGCINYKETSESIFRNKTGKIVPIKEGTVRRYERDIIKTLINHFENDEDIRADIYEAIKNEYSKYDSNQSWNN